MAASDDQQDREQSELHELISRLVAVREPDGAVLTGWIVCYEGISVDDSRGFAGHIYGPHEMTTWRALGIIEWIRRFCLRPDGEEEDDG